MDPAPPPLDPAAPPPLDPNADPLQPPLDPNADPMQPPLDPAAPPPLDPNADPTPPRRPRPTGPIQYKGSDLEPAKGPGLGCFRFQVIVLVVLIVLTPLTVAWDWPPAVSAALLFIVIFLLLITGQTIIFLLRLVAADRRTRRRPMGSATKTVGELEDAATAEGDDASAEVPATVEAATTGDAVPTAPDDAPVDELEPPRDPA